MKILTDFLTFCQQKKKVHKKFCQANVLTSTVNRLVLFMKKINECINLTIAAYSNKGVFLASGK